MGPSGMIILLYYLDNFSFIFLGCGKTSLLNVLSGRYQYGKMVSNFIKGFLLFRVI
jgi:hypothetical protein